jgi:hypothetical protein
VDARYLRLERPTTKRAHANPWTGGRIDFLSLEGGEDLKERERDPDHERNQSEISQREDPSTTTVDEVAGR